MRKILAKKELRTKSSQQRTYAEFSEGGGGPWPADRREIENIEDLSQVEAPAGNSGYCPAIAIQGRQLSLISVRSLGTNRGVA
jgi:hypothetical protein